MRVMDFEYSSSLIRKINIDYIDFNNVPYAKETMRLVLNGYEELYCKYIEQVRQTQGYKNEVHMLKGEKDTPDIKPNTKNAAHETAKNDDDKIEPQPKKNWSKSSKKEKINTVLCSDKPNISDLQVVDESVCDCIKALVRFQLLLGIKLEEEIIRGKTPPNN